MKNLSKAYYKDYFSGSKVELRGNEIKVSNAQIFIKNKKLLKDADADYLKAANNILSNNKLPINAEFPLTVCYPGLVTGIGITHEAKIEGEFKLGMHLDYTTGLPVIYGSSVKGVLRSAFMADNLLEILLSLTEKREDRKYLQDLSEKFKSRSLGEWSKIIFGDDEDRDMCSVYERDIFFDAILYKSNQNGSFLSSDSITPHGSDPLKNPVPLTFVRIASGTKIKFRFKLVPTKTEDKEITIEDKEFLFKAILMAFGVGAKTNVGYGRLESV